jgi:hypothetical protein
MTLKKDNWGNQSIAGISNEELFSEDWAKAFKKAERAEIVKAYHSDPIFRELWEKRNREKVESASWRKHVAESNQRLAKDPRWLEINKKKNQELAKDPKWREASLKGTESRKAKGKMLKEAGKEKEFRELFGVKDNHSKKTKKQMSASASARWAKSMKKVMAEGNVYSSIYEAGEKLGIHKDTVVYRIKTKPTDYYFIED